MLVSLMRIYKVNFRKIYFLLVKLLMLLVNWVVIIFNGLLVVDIVVQKVFEDVSHENKKRQLFILCYYAKKNW